MNSLTQQVDALAKRVMAVQLAAAVLSAVVMYMLGRGGLSAFSAFCGGLVSLVVVMLLRRGIRKASEVALQDQRKSMAILYLGAVQRFVAILALFALGLGVLGLEPFAMFVGFVAAQAGNFISARFK